jgi:hypothetical protein
VSPWPPVTRQVALDRGVDAALEQIPTEAGVGQILGDEGRSLTIGRPADLRKWFGHQLGRAKVKKGQRPPTDLTAVARVLSFSVSTSQFGQRLAFERLMARYVPASARRDLKTPAYLHLDANERFPRVTIVMGGAGRSDLFGPFRDRKAADRARDGLHKLVSLRPCDFNFEPAVDLALGLSCLYAQVKTCAAPCLVRVSEDDYRGLARQAVELLTSPSARGAERPAWLPAFATTASTRAVIAERGTAGLELYPVVAGIVCEDTMTVVSDTVAPDDVRTAPSSLRWRVPDAPGADEAWLMSWLYERRRRGTYFVIPHGDSPPMDSVIQACASAVQAT